MADNIDPNVDPEVPETPEIVEPNETEVRAREQGWVPKEEWTGEGKWRDAESFLDRGELFQKIDSQRRKLRELEENQKAFGSHLKTVREAEFNRAMKTLLAEKKQALLDGDPDAVILADEKLAAVRSEATKAEFHHQNQPAQVQEPHPEFVAWTNRNPWFNNSSPMRAFAEAVGNELQASGVSDPARILKEVEAQVRKEFPHKFSNPNREKPSAIEGSSNKGNNAKESYALTDDERSVMNRLVKSGVMTKEQYIEDIKAATARGKR